MGLTRLFLPLYALSCPKNLFMNSLEITSTTGGPVSYIIVCLVFVQILILLLQVSDYVSIYVCIIICCLCRIC